MGLVNQYQRIADATVHVIGGASHGSGFHFLHPEIIVTNDHVVEGARTSARAETEAGEPLGLEYLTHSVEDEYDFAIYRVIGDVPTGRVTLEPDPSATPLPRGAEVLFAGFPHGVHELLVQHAIVSGPVDEDLGFYLDGSVNGGNSGGPIVSPESGKVVGITTASRYVTGMEWEPLAQEAQALEDHCAALSNPEQTRGVIMESSIQGIDFKRFAALVARSNRLIRTMLEDNANTGLGIGFNIDYVYTVCLEGGLTESPWGDRFPDPEPDPDPDPDPEPAAVSADEASESAKGTGMAEYEMYQWVRVPERYAHPERGREGQIMSGSDQPGCVVVKLGGDNTGMGGVVELPLAELTPVER